MEGKRTFIEWLSFINKPTESELFWKEMTKLRPCKGGCGKMIEGFNMNGLCTPCFSDSFLNNRKIIKWMP